MTGQFASDLRRRNPSASSKVRPKKMSIYFEPLKSLRIVETSETTPVGFAFDHQTCSTSYLAFVLPFQATFPYPSFYEYYKSKHVTERTDLLIAASVSGLIFFIICVACFIISGLFINSWALRKSVLQHVNICVTWAGFIVGGFDGDDAVAVRVDVDGETVDAEASVGFPPYIFADILHMFANSSSDMPAIID